MAAARAPLDTIGGILRSASGVVAPDASFDSYAELIRGLSQVPAPTGLQTVRVDPPSPYGAAACDRDYKAKCPRGFVMLGQTEKCVAGPRYVGPCSSEAYVFSAMSDAAKSRWSDQCFAFWPCVVCDRDHSRCPVGWVSASDGVSCSSPAEYTGSCKGTTSFANYNKEMLDQWSSKCGAFWPCKE